MLLLLQERKEEKEGGGEDESNVRCKAEWKHERRETQGNQVRCYYELVEMSLLP